jgi:short-subunit dehydrogenase
MRLEGKVVLITGAGSGIGQALAYGCAKRGAKLILVGRRHDKLHATRDGLGDGVNATCIAADVTTASGREAIVDAVRVFGRLDLLINNAGMVAAGRLETQPDDTLEALVQVNLLAPMRLTRDLLPLLRAADRPRVVNVGSMFGDIGHPLFASYSATKFGLRGFSDALRRELAPENIGVTYVAPRGTQTEATRGFQDVVDAFGMAVDSAEVAAAPILQAIERDARFAYPRGPERLFVWVQRLLPQVIDQALQRQLQKAAM